MESGVIVVECNGEIILYSPMPQQQQQRRSRRSSKLNSSANIGIRCTDTKSEYVVQTRNQAQQVLKKKLQQQQQLQTSKSASNTDGLKSQPKARIVSNKGKKPEVCSATQQPKQSVPSQQNNLDESHELQAQREVSASDKFPVVVLDRFKSADIERIGKQLKEEGKQQQVKQKSIPTTIDASKLEQVDMQNLIESAVNKYFDKIFGGIDVADLFPTIHDTGNDGNDTSVLSISSDEEMKIAVEMSLLDAIVQSRDAEIGESSQQTGNFFLYFFINWIFDILMF